jgi:hypothetical protein
VLCTLRGGFEVTIGQDLSIGHLRHLATAVRLYFQETFTFLMLTSEASAVLARKRSPPSSGRHQFVWAALVVCQLS